MVVPRRRNFPGFCFPILFFPDSFKIGKAYNFRVETMHVPWI